jgi:hypothetical protein
MAALYVNQFLASSNGFTKRCCIDEQGCNPVFRLPPVFQTAEFRIFAKISSNSSSYGSSSSILIPLVAATHSQNQFKLENQEVLETRD